MYGRAAEQERKNQFVALIARVPFWLALIAIILLWPKLHMTLDAMIWPYIQNEYGADVGTLMFFALLVAVTLAVFFLTQAGMTSSFVGFAVAMADRFVI